MYKNLVISILGIALLIGLGLFFTNREKTKETEDPLVIQPETPGVYTVDYTKNLSANVVPVDGLFGKNIALVVGGEANFSDGLYVFVKRLDDSRCPKDVQCIWAGEIAVSMDVSGGKIQIPDEIRLSTEKMKSKKIDGYTFSINSADKEGINFTVNTDKPNTVVNDCFVGGCSSEICSDQKDVASNCIYKPEFACYKNAKCERQAGGQCAWTNNNALLECMAPYYPGE